MKSLITPNSKKIERTTRKRICLMLSVQAQASKKRWAKALTNLPHRFSYIRL